MKSKLPKIKKELAAFLVGEEGRISKQYVLTIGAFLAMSALLAQNVKPAHTGSVSGTWTGSTSGGTLTGSHTHHGNHSSY
jgi:hypothetical protein